MGYFLLRGGGSGYPWILTFFKIASIAPKYSQPKFEANPIKNGKVSFEARGGRGGKGGRGGGGGGNMSTLM